MKNTEEHQQRVERIRKVIECTLAGWLPEEVGQYEQAQREEKLHKAVDDFLVRHPEWKPENGATAPTSAPVASQQVITDSGMKKRCIKALGAARLYKANGEAVVVSHTADSINPDELALAIAKCRELKATDPDRYNQDIRYV